MSAMASQITSLTIVYPTVYSGADQRKPKLRVTGTGWHEYVSQSETVSEYNVQSKIVNVDSI